jgi:hypothetical protein
MDAPRTIVAVLGEDARYRPIRETAQDRALESHATLIFYDLDAGRDPLESPLPTDWSAEGTEEEVADRLGPDELEAAGRHSIAKDVRAARNAGIDAWGWLPEHADKATLRAYAGDLVEPLILVPDDEPELRDAIEVDGQVVPLAGASNGGSR